MGRIEKIKKHVEESMKNHLYTRLVDPPYCTVWRCQEPGTSIYAFDIAITRFGIAVFGDIDGLIFRVGSDYGIRFLAGNDVGYYIHSKLESQCQEKEFDPEALKLYCLSEVVEHLSNHWTLMEPLPEWWGKPELAENKFDEVVEFLKKRYPSEGYGLKDYVIFLEDCEKCETIQEGCEHLRDAPFEISDFWELSPSQPSESLMTRLYMVNHAAKKIIEHIKMEEKNND